MMFALIGSEGAVCLEEAEPWRVAVVSDYANDKAQANLATLV